MEPGQHNDYSSDASMDAEQSDNTLTSQHLDSSTSISTTNLYSCGYNRIKNTQKVLNESMLNKLCKRDTMLRNQEWYQQNKNGGEINSGVEGNADNSDEVCNAVDGDKKLMNLIKTANLSVDQLNYLACSEGLVDYSLVHELDISVALRNALHDRHALQIAQKDRKEKKNQKTYFYRDNNQGNNVPLRRRAIEESYFHSVGDNPGTVSNRSQDQIESSLLLRMHEFNAIKFPVPQKSAQHMRRMTSHGFELFSRRNRRILQIHNREINVEFQASMKFLWDNMTKEERSPYIATAKYMFFFSIGFDRRMR